MANETRSGVFVRAFIYMIFHIRLYSELSKISDLAHSTMALKAHLANLANRITSNMIDHVPQSREQD